MKPPPSLSTLFLWQYSLRGRNEGELAELAERARATPEALVQRATRIYKIVQLPVILVGVAIALAPAALWILWLPANGGWQEVNLVLVGFVVAISFLVLVPGVVAVAGYFWARAMLSRRWANLANIEAVIRTGRPYLE